MKRAGNSSCDGSGVYTHQVIGLWCVIVCDGGALRRPSPPARRESRASAKGQYRERLKIVAGEHLNTSITCDMERGDGQHSWTIEDHRISVSRGRYEKSIAAMRLFLGSILLSVTACELSSKSKEVKPVEPGEESVFDRGLVSDKVTWKSIVKYRNSYSKLLEQHRNFSGDVLAYVTPWNNHGYDVAKTFGSKFTQVSPVWLQLRYDSSSAFVISGQHDIDSGWIREVRDTGAKMLPRILFEGWSPQQVHDLSVSSGKVATLGKVLTKFANENNFDGYVFELWSQYNYGGKLASELIAIIQGLWPSLSMAGLSLVLVIPPPLYDDIPGMFSRSHFDSLKDHVSAFSLMTYDYSNAQRPGPNAPLEWIRQCVEHLVPAGDAGDEDVAKYRRKILVGLNFYGYDYTAQGGSSAILGHQFAQLLQKYKPKISWSEQFAEHYVQIRGSEGHHMVFFPTLKSISSRIELATQLRTGLSIWEIGQGMDYFYDLL